MATDTHEMTEPRAVVIGAGFGGIAAALRLRARGYHVTLVDKLDQLGGRAAVFRRGGYVFDAGPTVVTAHFLFDELFALFGKRREDYITFVPVYPWYRIQFADGSKFDYGGTLEQTLAEIRRVSPGDEGGYLRLLEHTKKIFDVGFTQLGDVPFETLGSMLKCAPQLLKLGNWRTVYQMASKYIRSEKLRRVFSFQPLLVGATRSTRPASTRSSSTSNASGASTSPWAAPARSSPGSNGSCARRGSRFGPRPRSGKSRFTRPMPNARRKCGRGTRTQATSGLLTVA